MPRTFGEEIRKLKEKPRIFRGAGDSGLAAWKHLANFLHEH
jgi:hypothetical protein